MKKTAVLFIGLFFTISLVFSAPAFAVTISFSGPYYTVDGFVEIPGDPPTYVPIGDVLSVEVCTWYPLELLGYAIPPQGGAYSSFLFHAG